MIPKESIDNSIQELRILIDKMEAVLDSAPPGALIFKRYPNNERVPFLSIGSRKARRTSRVDHGLDHVVLVVNLYWKQQIGIIEHHGLLDDHKYRRRKMDNLETMMNHGIYPGQNLLILSESTEYGYDAALAKKLIAAFCLP